MGNKIYSVKETTMKKLADNIREITGTTGEIKGDSLITSVENNNEEIDTQAELISQIQTALQGKGAGGGGGSVETCTITLRDSGNLMFFNITQLINGKIVTTIILNYNHEELYVIENVVKGTKLVATYLDSTDHITEGEVVFDGRFFDDASDTHYSFTINGDCYIDG